MKPFIGILFLFLFIGKYHTNDIGMVATQTSFKLSFEELTLHEFADEKMRLMGGNILFQLEGYLWSCILKISAP